MVVAEEDEQYWAWVRSSEPFDFTGLSYLDEFTRPLRDLTPLAQELRARVDAARAKLRTSGDWPTLDEDKLRFIAEIDECIWEDGDYFLREGKVDDDQVELLAAGEELANRSRDFWPRLRELGATTLLARDANLLLSLRSPDEDAAARERSLLEASCLEAPPPGTVDHLLRGQIATRIMEGVDVPGDSFDVGAVRVRGELYTHLLAMNIAKLEKVAMAIVGRDDLALSAVMDAISAANEATARKRGEPSFTRLRVCRIRITPGSIVDTSFLEVETSSQAVSMNLARPIRRSVLLSRRRRCGARQRASRGGSTRTRGSRRRTTAGRSSSDDPDLPALARPGAYDVGPAVAHV